MSVAPVSSGVRQPNPLLVFARSSIGKKWIVAVSGTLLVAFILAHLAGNLTIYIGPYGEGINAYAKALHASPLVLWCARRLLVVSSSTSARRCGWCWRTAGRGARYAVKAHVQSTVSRPHGAEAGWSC